LASARALAASPEGKLPLVIKYGGHAMVNEELRSQFCRDIVLLKQLGLRPVVVHGGGPQIGKFLERLKIETNFINGLRVTCEQTMEAAEMVLSGNINKALANEISRAGAPAVGLSGKDGRLLVAEQVQGGQLGFVGEPKKVNTEVLSVLLEAGIVPVIAPVAAGEGEFEAATFNVNADTAAGAIAEALGAHRFLLCTDIAGVLDGEKQLIAEMDGKRALGLIDEGVAAGGMIPKLQTAVQAVQRGVGGCVILDGRVPHSVLVQLFSKESAGTTILP